jgi:hypothetical protein
MNTIADVETLYARLGERDYEASKKGWWLSVAGSLA